MGTGTLIHITIIITSRLVLPNIGLYDCTRNYPNTMLKLFITRWR